jgi:2,3-bisphosphoglycerate-dependent phosphoglycerate mutase
MRALGELISISIVLLCLLNVAEAYYNPIFSKTSYVHDWKRGSSSHSHSMQSRNPISQVEDDGYTLAQGKQGLLKKIRGLFGQPKPGNLILVRHGESILNANKTFTGWIDSDLSERGILETEHAARLLLERGYTVDTVYTSRLKRAIRSTWIILTEINQIFRPVFKSWRLNERMYGALEGYSKVQTALEMGEEHVQAYRVGLEGRPPIMPPDHPHWHGSERKYTDLDPKDIPTTESLQDTMERTIPLWNSRIYPDLRSGKTVMIVAHANSLRGILKHVDNLSKEEIKSVAIPNGIPLVYKFDKNMKPIKLPGAVTPISGEFLEKKVSAYLTKLSR